jgi:hypothetical protein
VRYPSKLSHLRSGGLALLDQVASDAVHDPAHLEPVTLRARRDVLRARQRAVERERERALGAHDLRERGAQLVRVVRGARERVERVAEAGEPDDVERRGREARDGVEPRGACRRVELRQPQVSQLQGRQPHADMPKRHAHLVGFIEEDTRELADLRGPKRRVEHAPLGAVRRALGDQDAPAESAAEESAHEQALLEGVRVREDVLDGAEIGCHHRALLHAARLSVHVLGGGREGDTHAKERAVHENVTMLGEPARLEHAIVILLELAEPAQS